jgi:hypothetical protein
MPNTNRPASMIENESSVAPSAKMIWPSITKLAKSTAPRCTPM